jgi:hypothetical protein
MPTNNNIMDIMYIMLCIEIHFMLFMIRSLMIKIVQI